MGDINGVKINFFLVLHDTCKGYVMLLDIVEK